MKKYIFFLLVILHVTSCDVLDKTPFDSVPPEEVWNSVSLSNMYLNDLYKDVLPSFGATTNANLSDETGGGGKYMQGTLAVDDVADFGSETYAKIRKINILFEGIETGTVPHADKQSIKGQAWFLRAFIYWNLVNLYGGVPMVMNVQTMSSTGELTPDLMVKRNSTKECVEIIARDLDSAAVNLPAQWSDQGKDYGRVTRGAALALKGRMLLFWASPQFNSRSGSMIDQKRWDWAYAANDTAIKVLKQDGYDLHPSFSELFTDCKEKTKEAIFVRVYDANVTATGTNYYHNYDASVRPAYMGKLDGKSNQPTWNLVKAFPKADGFNITETSTGSKTAKYNSIAFFRERDPRFYATIAYNSAYWPLAAGKASKPPFTEDPTHAWLYYRMKDGAMTSVETRGVAGNTTSSGFYCRKFVNPGISADYVDQVGTDWVEIRFAEVLLNMAECANEVDNRQLAYDNIKLIRDRAWAGPADTFPSHMGNISPSMTKEAMREAIMHERQIELAFENKRHFDLRRRNMFEENLGKTPKLNGTRRGAVRIYPKSLVEFSIDNEVEEGSINANNYTDYFQAPDTLWVLDTQYPINYPQPQYNFYAIPETNLQKNPNLQQTTFWGGSFDPLSERPSN